jgi:transposase
MIEKNSIKELDKSKPLFMGIDVHKRYWHICIVYSGEIIARFSTCSDFKILTRYLERYSGFKIYSCYEAGFIGFYLHRMLMSIGINNIIISPNKIPEIIGDKVKTDRKDCKKLAIYLSKGLLKAIHIPEEEDVHRRQIIRTREQYKEKRVRVICQLKALLIQYGYEVSKGKMNEDRIYNINSFDLPEDIKMSINIYLDELRYLDKVLLKLKEEYTKASESLAVKETVEIIESVPGIGRLIATILAFEIGDFSRFSNVKKISAYVGLTPSEYSSGEHVRRGHITGQGRYSLRALLIEASWKLINKDESMQIAFERIRRNTGSKKKAIVAIARKLICRLHAMIRTKTKYELNYNYNMTEAA